MQTLQLQFPFMEEVEPRPTPSNDNFPSDEGQASDQTAKPVRAPVAAASQPPTGPSPIR